MQRAATHRLPRGMALLGLVEFMLCFAVIQIAIGAAGTSHAQPVLAEALPRSDIALAAVLTLVIGGVALTGGLYRPEVCLDRKRLLIATFLVAIIAFAALLFVTGGPRNALIHGRALYLAEALAVWLAIMTLIRLVYSFAVIRTSLGRRLLLLGDPRQVGTISVRLRAVRGHLFDPVVLQGHSVSWPLLRQQRIWGVVVASEPAGQAVEALLDCKLRGLPILSGATFHERYLGRIDLEALTANDLLLSQGFATSKLSGALKRLSDLIVGACMLVLCCR
jgi:hypothetical protein